MVNKTVDIVATKYPDLEVAGKHHGFFWDDEEAVAKNIRESGVKLLFVAINVTEERNFLKNGETNWALTLSWGWVVF